MRLPLFVLTAALILVAIRWWGTDGPAVVRSAPRPIVQTRDGEAAAALVPSDDLEQVQSTADGRQAVADKDSVPTKCVLPVSLPDPRQRPRYRGLRSINRMKGRRCRPDQVRHGVRISTRP